MGISLLGGHAADVQEEFLVAGRPEEVLGDPQQGLREEERAPEGIPAPVDFKQGPGEPLGVLLVIPVRPARELPPRPDGGHAAQVPGDLPGDSDFRENGLSAPRDGQL